MHRILPIFILTVCGISISPLVFALPIIARHHPSGAGGMNTMIHLEPNDSPAAGKPAKTWFILTRRNGEMISAENCDCHVAAFNTRNHAIAEYFPLAAMPMEAHQAGQQALGTTITFPKSGAYTVVLSGKAKDKSFDPFELKFSVAVRP